MDAEVSKGLSHMAHVTALGSAVRNVHVPHASDVDVDSVCGRLSLSASTPCADEEVSKGLLHMAHITASGSALRNVHAPHARDEVLSLRASSRSAGKGSSSTTRGLFFDGDTDCTHFSINAALCLRSFALDVDGDDLWSK